MKKLMIAACAVAMSAAVQAANVTWGFGNTVYLADTGSTATTLAKSAGTDLKAKFANYSLVLALLDDSSFELSDITSENIVDSLGYSIKSNNGKWNPATKSTALTDAMEGKYLAILVDTGNGYDYVYALKDSKKDVAFTAATEVTADNISGKTALTIFATGGDAVSGVLQAAAVPEPTSAMLLLLGVAGLALKRRRA